MADRRLSGALMRVLKHSRVAWYRGNGITAYYEQPSPGIPGVLVVNGKRVTDLVVDRIGLYADFPSPNVQHLMTERGVDLERGWMCPIETYGSSLHEAIQHSRFWAARHHNGRVCVQCIDQSRAAIFVDGVWWWTIQYGQAHRALVEVEVSILEGWYPLQQDLFRESQRTG